MDPYLEDPLYWPGIHSSLIVYACAALQPHLRPRYVAAIEERVYVQGPERVVVPDGTIHRLQGARRARGGAAVLEADEPVILQVEPEEIHESLIQILDLKHGKKVVAVIEVVSPSNKIAGPGRESYKKKQAEVLAGDAHLVEIDLLRLGRHILAAPESLVRSQWVYDYLVSVNRAETSRDRFALYRRLLRDRLPRIRIPLADDDPDVILDLQAVFSMAYEGGGYRDRIDYTSPCLTPLSPSDQQWADGVIQKALADEPSEG